MSLHSCHKPKPNGWLEGHKLSLVVKYAKLPYRKVVGLGPPSK